MEDQITSESRFAIVPEWVLDAPISDRAVRLYAVLARYADHANHTCFPARSTLAARLSCSTDSVDRALAELTEAGAISVKRRGGNKGDGWTSNLYTLRVAAPVRVGSRKGAAREAARVRLGRPHGCGTNENQSNESQVNDTRPATDSAFGAKAQRAIASVVQEGRDEQAVIEAATWLRSNDLPIAAFRIKKRLDGETQPRTDETGKVATIPADRKTDWAAEAADADPDTGESPF